MRRGVALAAPAAAAALLLVLGVAPAAAAPAPALDGWEAVAAGAAIVYVVPGTVSPQEAAAAGEQLDALLGTLSQITGLRFAAPLAYPLYPSVDRFGQDWWLFASLPGVVHGWGTLAAHWRSAGGGSVPPPPAVIYQVARLLVRQRIPPGIPVLSWGLGDLLADRRLGINSHAHARMFLDHGDLPPVERIIHQADFARVLPASHAQAVSFLADLAAQHGMASVIHFATDPRLRWYEFESRFLERFGLPLLEADTRWRAHLGTVSAPPLSEVQWDAYLRAIEFADTHTLAMTPARLLVRPGGASGYIEALQATAALRRFDTATALRSASAGRDALDRVPRRRAFIRVALRTGIYLLAVAPIALAVALLAGPSIVHAWRARRRHPRAGVWRT